MKHPNTPSSPKPFESLLAESKFRVRDPWRVRSICEENCARPIGADIQTDTYFRAPHGRLQLRESSHSGSFLLSFADGQVTRMPVAAPATMKSILAEQLGVKLVVKKRREIFLLEDALVNLDDVANLGFFLKFEGAFDAVEHKLRPMGLSRLFELQQLFKVSLHDSERRSYYSLRKRAESENALEFDAFTNVRILATMAADGSLQDATRTETYVGAWE